MTAHVHHFHLYLFIMLVATASLCILAVIIKMKNRNSQLMKYSHQTNQDNHSLQELYYTVSGTSYSNTQAQ